MLKNTLLVCLTIFSINVYAEVVTGRVVGISDGDTIVLMDANSTQYKVRLSGIDAPEKKQAFGQASKKSLSDLIYEKEVKIDWHKQDRYGRLVGKIIFEGEDINLAQIKRGMAWFFRKYQKEQPHEDRLNYLLSERAARESHVGLWIDKEPVAPWDFRKK